MGFGVSVAEWQAAGLIAAWLVFTGWSYREALAERWPALLGFMAAGDSPVSSSQAASQTATNGRPLLLAYASESGHARSLAQACQQQLGAQSSRLLTLNQLLPERLQNADVLVFASTTGEGDAPDNGARFLTHLNSSGLAAEHADRRLANTRFAVMALGDVSYPHYCAFGLTLQQALQQAGATPLFDAVCVDDLNPADIDLFYQQLAAAAAVYPDMPFDAASLAGADQGAAQEVSQSTSSSGSGPDHEPTSLTLLKRQCLNEGTLGEGIYQIDFALPAEPERALQWQAGDVARLHLPAADGSWQHRDYTLASLPSEGTLRLLVRQQFHPPKGNQPRQPGLGSGLLTLSLATGDAARFEIIHNPNFHSPAADVPMILIGNGTGLAGLRAHLKQREGLAQARHWLIFGERSLEHDALWHDELSAWLQNDTLSRLDLAFSRSTIEQLQQTPLDAANPTGFAECGGQFWHGYVQHAIEQQLDTLKEWLDDGAMIYVCGSRAGMAKGVDQVLRAGFGDDYVDDLDTSGRYRRDVY